MASRRRARGESSSTTAHDDITRSPWTSQNLGDTEAPPTGVALLSCYERENGVVRSMAAGKHGRLYTLSSDSTNIRFWNRGEPDGGFHAENTPNVALLLLNIGGGNHVGGRIHVGSSDGRVRIWGVPAINPPKFTHLHERVLPCLEDDTKKKIWKKKMKKVLQRSTWENWQSFPVTCMSFSKVSEDTPYLYTGSTDCSIKVWSLNNWTLLDILKRHEDTVNSVAAGCDDRMFSASQDGSVVMWLRIQKGTRTNNISHTVVDTLLSGPVSVNALFLKSTTTGFANEAGRGELYAGLADGTVLVWKERLNFSTRALDVETLRGHEVAVTCVAGSPGHLVFSGSEDGKICAWSSKNGSEEHTLLIKLNAHGGPVNCIAAQEDWERNDDGNWSGILYSGGEDKTLKTWRIKCI